jgi:hypothetical protein
VKIYFVSSSRTTLTKKAHVGSDQVDLGVTVLSSLGGRHVDDLTGSSLDEDVSTLPAGRTLGAVCQYDFYVILQVRHKHLRVGLGSS